MGKRRKRAGKRADGRIMKREIGCKVEIHEAFGFVEKLKAFLLS